jgi:uncharacterized protein
MHPAIPHLIELQAVDHRIAAVRAELETFPKRVMEADAKLNGARTALAAAKEAHSSKLKERKKFELDAQQWKERAAKYRDQSSAVKTNEAYRALQHEIATAEGEVAKAEDAQLEAMMAIEEAEGQVRHAEADLKEFEKLVAGDLHKIQALNTEKKKELNAALAEREKVIATVPQDLRELYDRVAKRHHGTAMARVRDEQCGGCGMRILPHIIQELRLESNEEIYRCETCGLILYTLDPIAAPNSTPDSGDSASSAAANS